jgi:ATP-binding cassette subfamily B protein
MHSLLALFATLQTKRRIQFGLILVLMTMGSVLEAMSVGAVLPFLGGLTNPDSIFSNKLVQPLLQIIEITSPRQLQLGLAALFAATVLLAAAVRLAVLWANTRLGHAIGADISIELYRRTLYQPYTAQLARNSSEIISGIATKSSKVALNTILPILAALSSCFILVTIIFALISIDPIVATSTFGGLGAVYIIVFRLTSSRLAINSRRYNEGVTRVIKVLQEALGGIKDVLIDGTQEVHSKIFRDTDLAQRRADANIAILANGPKYVIEALDLVLLAALAFILSGRPGGLLDIIPVLGALALGSIRLLSVLQQGYSAWASIRGSDAALRDVLDLLKQPLPEYASTIKFEPMPFSSAIELCGVNFRYLHDGVEVLTRVDLKIPKGSRVGLIGKTGSGKSTLVDIIMGLLPPTKGTLQIDGEIITKRNVRSWQMHIAHVPQFIFLSDASIAENIAFGVPFDEIDMDRMRLAAKQAQISDFVEGLASQYDATVGERGVRLSGGQRQRLGIARALYKQADVIVFDEATSALDAETEAAVINAICSLNPSLTIIMIAHRLATLRGCTQLVELSAGGINRVGKFEELVSA